MDSFCSFLVCRVDALHPEAAGPQIIQLLRTGPSVVCHAPASCKTCHVTSTGACPSKQLAVSRLLFAHLHLQLHLQLQPHHLSVFKAWIVCCAYCSARRDILAHCHFHFFLELLFFCRLTLALSISVSLLVLSFKLSLLCTIIIHSLPSALLRSFVTAIFLVPSVNFFPSQQPHLATSYLVTAMAMMRPSPSSSSSCCVLLSSLSSHLLVPVPFRS